MAVAEKTTPETTAPGRLDPLVLNSLLGTLYVLGSIGVVFYGVPALWWSSVTRVTGLLGSFFDGALFLLAMVASAAVLIVGGFRILGQHPPRGVRAGIFVGIAGLFTIGFVTWAVGRVLEAYASPPVVGLIVMGAVGLALCVLAAIGLLRPGLEPLLVQLEDQGWFTAAPYKKSQGLPVRRGTLWGILIVIGAGIYTLVSHNSLGAGAGNDVVLRIPFTEVSRVILPDRHFSVPLLLSLASLWFAYRVVHFPMFADFLIATDAELKKVSWTTRKRLVQDTIVVLTTVILMTLFLFFVDIAWFKLLTNPWIGILSVNPTAQATKVDEQEQPW